MLIERKSYVTMIQMLSGQFLRIGWKMVMLGDETWLKLFPGLFMRHDGVSSFFVSLCVIFCFSLVDCLLIYIMVI